MIKLCIFDLDGTVLDTVGSIAYYGNYALKKNGIQPIAEDEYKYLAGNGIANLIKNMLEVREVYSDELYKKVFSDYDNAYNSDVAFGSHMFDGLKDELDTLKSKGIRLAIVSNKPDFAARTVVSALYGEGYFDFVTGQKPGVALKPDPNVVLSVMRKFGVSAGECMYFGDTSTDMITGKRAGLYTVGVLWGFRLRDELLQSGADVIVEQPKGLAKLVFDCSNSVK